MKLEEITQLRAAVVFRVDNVNDEHTSLTVFTGLNTGALAHSGTIVLRTDELVELLAPAAVEEALGSGHLVLFGQLRFADDSQIETLRTAVDRRGGSR